MAKPTTSTSPVDSIDQRSTSEVSEVLTDWSVFEKAGLVPDEIQCVAYKPHHPQDMSCHTKLTLFAKNLVAHANPEHGSDGGFTIRLRRARVNDKPELLNFWRDVREAGLEIVDFRCDHCKKEVRLHPKSILAEFKPHKGTSRSSVMRGFFNFTLSVGMPAAQEDDFDEQYA